MKSLSPLVCLLILTGSFTLIVGVQSLQLDFPLTDGAYYFDRAQLFADSGVRPDREWSPLFVIGYGFYHLVFPDSTPLLLYLTHRFLVLLAVVVLFWLFARRLFPELPSLVLSLAFLGNGAVLFDYPVVHVAGVGVVLLLLLLSTYSPRSPATLPNLVGVSLLGIWVRPEILTVLVALGALLAYRLWQRRRVGGIAAAGTLAIFLLLSLAVYGLSSSSPGPSRSFEAFSQRYVWSGLQASGSSLRSGHLDHTERVAEVFGEAGSVPAALLRNPGAFFEHMLGNVPRLLLEAPWVFLPGSSERPWVPLLFLVLLFSLLPSHGPGAPTNPLLWVASGAAAVAAVVLGLVLEPAAHYLLPAAPFFLVAGTMLLQRIRGSMPAWDALTRKAGPRLAQIACWGGLAALVVSLVAWNPGGERQVTKLAKSLAAAEQELGEIRLQGFSGLSYCSYLRALDRPCQEVPIELHRSTRELATFLQVEEVNALVVDDFLRRYYEDSASRVLRRFEAAPERFGFKRVEQTSGGFLGDANLYLRARPQG